MNNPRLPYWLAFFFLVAALYGGWKWYQVRDHQMSYGVSEPKLPPLEDFELTRSDGETFRSADMKGKVWVASFFFSTCPGTCSRLNANIKQFTTRDELTDVTWVSMSVDPVTDTLPVLEAYAENLGADPARWYFVRGEMDYMKRIGQDYLKLPVLYKDHNEVVAVIDRQGEIRGYYNALSTREGEKLRLKLLEVLAEPTPEPEDEPEEPATDEAVPEAETEAIAPEGRVA